MLEDQDGTVIVESRAIAYYLALRYAEKGPPLVPTDLKDITAFSKFQMFLTLEVEEFHMHALPLISQSIIVP